MACVTLQACHHLLVDLCDEPFYKFTYRPEWKASRPFFLPTVTLSDPITASRTRHAVSRSQIWRPRHEASTVTQQDEDGRRRSKRERLIELLLADLPYLALALVILAIIHQVQEGQHHQTVSK